MERLYIDTSVGNQITKGNFRTMKAIAKKDKSVNERLREIRDQISLDIKDMDHKQLKKYLKSKKSLFPASVWVKK